MNSSWSSEDILHLFDCYSFITEDQKVLLKEKQYQPNQLNRNLLGILNELKITEQQPRDKILLDWNQISLKQLSPSVFLSQRRPQPSPAKSAEKGRPSLVKAYDKALSSRTLVDDVDDDDVIDEIYFFELDEINPPPTIQPQLSTSNSYNNLSSPRRVAFNGESERFSENIASNPSISLTSSLKIPTSTNLQVSLSPEKSQSNLPSISLESIGKNSSFAKSSNFLSSSADRNQIHELLTTVDELHKVIEVSNNEKFNLQQKITDMEEELSEEKKLLRLSTQEMKAIQNENNSLIEENTKLTDSLLKLRERCDKLMVLQKRTTLLVNSQNGKDRKIILPSMKEDQDYDDQSILSLIDSIDDDLMMKMIDEYMIEKECQTNITVNPSSDYQFQENNGNTGSAVSALHSPRSILVNGNGSNSNPALISPRGRRIAFQNEENVGISTTAYDEKDDTPKIVREKELKIIELEKCKKDSSKQISTLTDMIDLLQEKINGVSIQNQQLSNAYSELLSRYQQLEEANQQFQSGLSPESQSPQQRQLHRTSPQRNLRSMKSSNQEEEEEVDEEGGAGAGVRDRSIGNNSETYYLKYDGHYHYSYQPLNTSTEENPTSSSFPLSSPVMVSSNHLHHHRHSPDFYESPIKQLSHQPQLLNSSSPQQPDYYHDFDSVSSHPEDNHPEQLLQQQQHQHQQQLQQLQQLQQHRDLEDQPVTVDNENDNFFITQEKWIRKEAVYLANIHYLLELLQELSDAYQRMLKKVAVFQTDETRRSGQQSNREGVQLEVEEEGSLLRQHWFRSSTQQLINSFYKTTESQNLEEEKEENHKKADEETLSRLLESNYRFLQKQQQLLTLQTEQGTYLPLPSPTTRCNHGDNSHNLESGRNGVSKSQKELCKINNEKYFNLLKEHYKLTHSDSYSPRSLSSSYLHLSNQSNRKSLKYHYLTDTRSTQQRVDSKQRPLGGYKHPVAALKPYITLVRPKSPMSSSAPSSPTARDVKQILKEVVAAQPQPQPHHPKRPKSANNAIRPSSSKSSSRNNNLHRKLVGY
jgi:hypothetical protein